MDNSNQYNYCIVASRTDIGCKRAANEDSMGQLDTINGRVVVVCDGMGGHVGGATASKIAVETILEFLNGQRFEDIREGMGMAIDAANRAILAYANTHPELIGMGSTCVLLVVRDGFVYIAHVGDSRIYLIRNRIITQLTKDHSYVQMLVDSGEITKEQAENHPRKNEITNALGIPQMAPATVKEDAIMPEAGDSFLLCSDGLSGPVAEQAINKIVSDHSARLQQRVDLLIEKARENGGPDNITAQIVEFVMAPTELASSRKKIHPAIWYALGTLVLIAIGVTLFFVHKRKAKSEDANETKTIVVEETEDEPSGNSDVSVQATAEQDNSAIVFPPSSEQQEHRPTDKIETVTITVGDSVVIRMEQKKTTVYLGGTTIDLDNKWKLTEFNLQFSIDSVDNHTLYVWRNDGDFSENKIFKLIFANSKRDQKTYKIVALKGKSADPKSNVVETNTDGKATNATSANGNGDNPAVANSDTTHSEEPESSGVEGQESTPNVDASDVAESTQDKGQDNSQKAQ